MAKYVCDFDQVRQAANDLISDANDVSVDTFSTDLDSQLSGWQGDAKDSFNESKNAILEKTKTDVSDVIALGEYINAAVSKIESLEEELSTYEI